MTVITKCDKKLLQNVTGIDKNFDKKLFPRVANITKLGNYYKVSRKIQFKKNSSMVKDIRRLLEKNIFDTLKFKSQV